MRPDDAVVHASHPDEGKDAPPGGGQARVDTDDEWFAGVDRRGRLAERSQHSVGEVGVGVNALHVIEILEFLKQPERLRRLLGP